MEKVKLVFFLFVGLVLLSLGGWGAYALVVELGFWKFAALTLMVEFFFIARGSYLASGAAQIYVEELRALRVDMENLGSRESLRCGLPTPDPHLLGRTAFTRILAVLTVLLLSGVGYLFYGFLASAAVIVMSIFALAVGMVYVFRKSYMAAQQELEDIRLTFLRNDNSSLLKKD